MQLLRDNLTVSIDTAREKTRAAFSELQILGGTKDNSKKFFLPSQRKRVVTPHWNSLSETVQMAGYNIHFYELIHTLNYYNNLIIRIV